MLEILQKLPEIDTLLIISKAAKRTIVLETDYKVDQVEKLANEASLFLEKGDIEKAINLYSQVVESDP